MLCTDLFSREERWWWRKVWKLRYPTKARLITWTNFENKTPTWDVLKQRNHHGPGWCCLCKDEMKIFLICLFIVISQRRFGRSYLQCMANSLGGKEK